MLQMSRNGLNRLDRLLVAEKGWKLLESLKAARNYWKWMEMVGTDISGW